MNKVLYVVCAWMAVGLMLTSCKDDETYAEQKEKERKAVANFLARNPLVLQNSQGDELLRTKKIKVISEQAFYAQDSTTNVEENEYVLFGSTGVYMQIVREGNGQRIQEGETKRLICRYFEYNILGDSLQTASNVVYWATTPDIMDVSNTMAPESSTLAPDRFEAASALIRLETSSARTPTSLSSCTC